MYLHIKSENYKTGAIEFIKITHECYKTDVVLVIGVSFLLAIIAAGITCACIVYTYKRKVRSEKYPLDHYAKLDLRVERDVFITKFITRRTIQTSSGKGRGGRSGVGRGGGHRGGR